MAVRCTGDTTTTVTVLFTDLVSSTQLTCRPGESAFDELRQPHLALLGQTITAHGGVTVKSLGDRVMAVFPAASDAVAAAVAMQQAVQRRGHRAPARLSMRVGLALGDATPYAGDWFGTPVVQAARLCDQCGGDEILVTDTVRAVAEARTSARFAPVRTLLLRGLAEFAVWKLDWAQATAPAAVALRVELSEQAVTMARRLGDPHTLAQVLIPVLHTLRHPSTLAQRLSLVTELAELGDQLGDDHVAFSAAWYGIGAALEAGDTDLAQYRLADATRLGDDLAQPALQWVMAIPHAGLTVLAGQVHEGERLAYQGLEVGVSAGYPDARLFFAIQLLAIRIVQDRMGELDALVTEIVAQYPGLWAWQAVHALVYCKLDRWDETHLVFDMLAADDFAGRHYDVNWLMGMALSAEVCAELGDVPGATVLSRLLAPYADQFVTTGPLSCLGSVAQYLGRLAATVGRLDEADAHFAAAATAHTRIGAPAWLARTQLDRADLLLTRQGHSDVQVATTLLGQALATARQLALGTLERRAVTLIEKAHQASLLEDQA